MNLLSRLVTTAGACATAISPIESQAQAAAPLRQLSAAEVTSALRLGAIERVRPLTNGRVLVNDSRFRQLLVFDSLLSSVAVALDSTGSAPIRYTKSGSPLLPYLADSSVIRFANSAQFLVIDPNGRVAHELNPAKPGEELVQVTAPKGFDAEGNPIAPAFSISMKLGNGWYLPAPAQIVRMNYATRQEERVAVFQRAPVNLMRQQPDAKGTLRPVRTVNPLVLQDDWTLLSDGTVAVVHAKDYNVELFHANGQRLATTKLPFEKRKLNNADKLAEGEARRLAMLLQDEEDFAADLARQGRTEAAATVLLKADSMRYLARNSGGKFELTLPQSAPHIDIEMVPARQMLDYLPPFRAGGSGVEHVVIADEDARVWIRTTDTAGATAGETLYDVVNNLGDYVQRVRVPAGRTIVGFGRNGVVYLKFQEGPSKWALERRRVVN